MNTVHNPRVRFAPAPTGMMHLGNIRTALMNYLLSHQKQGTFILRVEDTDLERNFDPGAQCIQEDLTWLGLMYDEGPGKERPEMAPYFQSQRGEIYQRELHKCIEKEMFYRCFCSAEELEKKRQRQIALKQPPRYDRTCAELSHPESQLKAATLPFIWRMKVDHNQTVTITDLAHGPINFDLKNFSDFPITRQDGTVTFMFANFIDDVLMKIDYVIRGEDHLTNTAGQAAMYLAYGAKLPLFWHMPILCSIDGKKLSKRDFGFSLRDLKDAGFLPQAIVNYLAIIGASFANEIMDTKELIAAMNFDHMSTTGQIKYDVEKLRWVNHKWISRLDLATATQECLPFLHEAYPATKDLPIETVQKAISSIHHEMVTLRDCVTMLTFYFDVPVYEKDIARSLATKAEASEESATLQRAALYAVIKNGIACGTIDECVATAKKEAASSGISPKQLFSFIRYGLTGSATGIGIAQLSELLSYAVVQKRLASFLELLAE